MGAQFRSRFVFKLLTSFDSNVQLEWHYMEAHHGKGPMDGVGDTIKNKVFKEVKNNRLKVKSPQEFAVAAQNLVPSIETTYMSLQEMLEEPADIEASPKIPDTLQIHKLKRKFNQRGVAYIEFSKLSIDEPYFTQYYQAVCGHKEHISIDENTCGQCLVKYCDSEANDWLKCPICNVWFHEACFHEKA